MSKFRVGQRVRVVKAYTERGAVHVGKSGVVNEIFQAPSWSVPSYGLDISPIVFDEGWWGWDECQLEPATDCYDKTEWDACVWKPEHLRVGA